MQRAPQRHYSVDEYFAVEAGSSIKHEYFNGEIFATAGASVAHNDIAANVLTVLRTALRGTGCRAFGSDLRLRAPGGLFTYPDVMLICGQLELSPDRPDTVVNPAVLVEVLSDATRDYDRGEKFALYKTIPTLREYVLIEQDRVAVDHFQLKTPSNWASASYSSLADSLSLNVVHVGLPLSDVYRDVFGPQVE